MLKASILFQLSYQNKDSALPIGFELVAETEAYFDKKTDKIKRRSPVTKNEMACAMIFQAVKDQVVFGYVLTDSVVFIG